MGVSVTGKALSKGGVSFSKHILFSGSVTEYTLPESRNWVDITYGNGLFATIANGSDKVATSSDGISWSESTIPGGNRPWTSIAFGEGKFIAISGGQDIAISTNGTSWTVTSPLPSGSNWESLTYNNGKFFATSSNNAKAASSTDGGVFWSDITMPGGNPFSSVSGNGANTLVTTRSDNTTLAYYSSNNGSAFSVAVYPFARSWRSTAFGNGTYVAVSTSIDAAYSLNNGASWTATTMPITASWQDVAFATATGTFLATANNQTNAAMSIDGINWSSITGLSLRNWTSVASNGTIFVSPAYGSSEVAVFT